MVDQINKNLNYRTNMKSGLIPSNVITQLKLINSQKLDLETLIMGFNLVIKAKIKFKGT